MTTFHAIQRTKERAGYNHAGSTRFIENAIMRGKGIEEFGSIEREYLKYEERKQGCKVLVYNSYCFIISNEGICITMFKLPIWFGRKRRNTGRKYSRKPKSELKRHLRHIYCSLDNDDEYWQAS